ncbi:hypothetical protein D3C75_1025550 [compost metagenome]
MLGGTRSGAAPSGDGFKSSKDRMELRGAAGLDSKNSHPRGEMLTALTPLGPAKAFCAPITAKSTPHSSTFSASPPTAETESETVISLYFCASLNMS